MRTVHPAPDHPRADRERPRPASAATIAGETRACEGWLR